MAKRRKKVELPDSVRGVLASNLETILTTVPALNSQPKIAAKGKLGQSSVGRVFRAEVAVNLDNLEGLARAANLAPWQLLVPGLDPLHPPELSTGELEKDEAEILRLYRQATSRWRIAIRYMAALRPESKQEEAGAFMLSKIFAEPAKDERLGKNWTRPDAEARQLHEPKAKYEKTKK